LHHFVKVFVARL